MVDFTEKYENIKSLANLCKYEESMQTIQELLDNLELTKREYFLIKLEQIRIIKTQSKLHKGLEKALENYHKCQIEGFPLLALDFVIECVECFWRLGQIEKALEYYNLGNQLMASLPKITQKELAKREAKLGITFCIILKHKGNYENALLLVNELLPKQKKYGNKREIAGLLLVKAVIFTKQGQMDLALKNLLEILPICQEINAISLLQAIYNNIGWSYERMGNFQDALRYLKKSTEGIKLINKVNLGQNQYVRLKSAKAYQKCGSKIFNTQEDIFVEKTLKKIGKMSYGEGDIIDPIALHLADHHFQNGHAINRH